MQKKIIALIIPIVLFAAIVVPVSTHSGTTSNTLDVVILAGQSNAEYGYTNDTTDPALVNEEYQETPTHKLYYYGGDRPANPWFASWGSWGVQEMYNDAWTIGGYEPILANEISKKTNHDVIVINMGVGARTVYQLNPHNHQYPGVYGKTVLDSALTEISPEYSNLSMLGWIWIQGESDKDTPIAEYIAQFREVQSFFKSYGAEKCYIVHTRDYYGGNANLAQDQLVANDDNIMYATFASDSFTVENGTLVSWEPIHYSQKGRDIIAHDLIEAIAIPAPSENANYTMLAIIPLIILVAIVAFAAKILIVRRT